MVNVIEVHWTTGSLDEARRISRYLVQERLVVCAQIIPWIESIFLWDNRLETVQETKVTFKTTETLYEEVRKAIRQNCTYQVPEITFIKLDGGNREFLDWVAETARKQEEVLKQSL